MAKTYSFEALGLLHCDMDESFVNILNLASRALDAPLAHIAVLEKQAGLQSISASIGSLFAPNERCEIAIEDTICQYVQETCDTVVIPDLLADPRTRDNEMIQQNGLRSYIGSPIHTMTGKVIGSLCCMAKTPRDWSDKDIQMLESLSKCVDDIVIARTLALEDQAARKQLKDIAAARGAYIAHVGHEIRTPLTGILGSIGILKGLPLDEKPARLVKILDKSAHKLLEFVNDVLDLARLDAGPSDVAEEVARIGDFMKDQLKEFSIQAGEKGLTLRLEDRLQNACYRFDATALARIVQNIVSNAVKFTNVGSIDVTLDQDSYGQVVIDVSDTGIGIAPEYHSKIFEEFEQADEAAARRYGGTGLGMAIVKRTVDRLNGTITIDSARGVGTKISVSLPLSTAGADCDAA